MQRDYEAALALFEQRIAASQHDPRARIAAADLYRTHGENPKRAAELYREVQRISDVGSGSDIYVTNKLVDLYLGALKEPGRALVELRRLADRYPGSTAAKHAKMAIARESIIPTVAARPLIPSRRLMALTAASSHTSVTGMLSKPSSTVHPKN